MQIGSFGDVIFEVSSDLILTPERLSRESKARFAEHKVIGRTPILEFLGREIEEIKFTAKFARELGITDLLQEVHKLREKCWNGTAEFFILNNHLYTEHKMVIESLGEEVRRFDGRGAHILTEIDVTLKEYVEVLQDDI